MSLLVLNNVINDDITNETVKTHGSAKSRYITKKVALNQASTRLDVLFDLAKPEGTDVKVFVRADVLTAGTNTNEAFELMTGDNIPPNSGSEALRANFDEVRFKFDLTRLALLTVNNTTDNSDAPGGFTTGVNSFKEFEVKIVMLSSEPAIVPQIRNLRCVATV